MSFEEVLEIADCGSRKGQESGLRIGLETTFDEIEFIKRAFRRSSRAGRTAKSRG
jgi:hypothetical protein